MVSRRTGGRYRTYVILVLPTCLLPWGYVEVDSAAFCLQHIKVLARTAGSTLATLATYVDNGKAADWPRLPAVHVGQGRGLYNEDAEVDCGWVNVTR